MALQLTGVISMNDIVQEMNFASNVTMDLRLQNSSGTKQVWINGAWRNLNMCSPYLPSHTAPFEIDHWYGYNHNAIGVTSVIISGTIVVTAGVQYTYTANLNGNNFTGATYQWEKYESGAWSNLGTSSTQNVTWGVPSGAKIKVTVSGICNSGSVTNTQDITNACTVPSSVVITGDTGTSGTGQRTYTLSSFSGTNSGATYNWTVGNYATITSGQGTNSITVNFSFNDAYSSLSTTVKVNVSNGCGNADSNIITVTPYIYQNSAETRYWDKNNCENGGVGSTVGYTLNTGDRKAYDVFTLQNDINNYFDSGGQTNANNNGACTWTGDEYSESVCKNDGCAQYYLPNCGIFYASWQAGGLSNYQSTISKANANGLAVSWVQANKQFWANGNLGCYQSEFGNVAKSASAFKNNCSSLNSLYCNTGTQRTLTIAANTYYRSTQQLADDYAQEVANNGVQTWVNDNYGIGDCYQCTFGNDNTVYADATTQNCGAGYAGCNVRFWVYPNTVYANSQAQANIDAQTYANNNAQSNANNNQCCTPICINGAPTNVIATRTGTAIVRVQWTDNAVDEYFLIEYSANGGAWQIYGTVSENTTSVHTTSWIYDISLKFRVKSITNCSTTTSAESNTVLSTPSRPYNVSAITVSGNQGIVWNNDNPSGTIHIFRGDVGFMAGFGVAYQYTYVQALGGFIGPSSIGSTQQAFIDNVHVEPGESVTKNYQVFYTDDAGASSGGSFTSVSITYTNP